MITAANLHLTACCELCNESSRFQPTWGLLHSSWEIQSAFQRASRACNFYGEFVWCAEGPHACRLRTIAIGCADAAAMAFNSKLNRRMLFLLHDTRRQDRTWLQGNFPTPTRAGQSKSTLMTVRTMVLGRRRSPKTISQPRSRLEPVATGGHRGIGTAELLTIDQSLAIATLSNDCL